MDTEGKTQRDLFGDMRAEYVSNRSIRNQEIRITSNTPDPVDLKVETLQPSTEDYNQQPLVTTTAKLNQQFFVWKNGSAGRMSVDTPFGFKGI
jgi:hypothetical protein